MDLDFLLVNIGSTELFKLVPEFLNRGYKAGIISGSPRHFKDNEDIQRIVPYWHINDIINKYKKRIKHDEDTVNQIKQEFKVPCIHSFYFPHMSYRAPYCSYDDFYKLSNDSENEVLFEKTIKTFQAIKFFFEDNNIKCTIQNLGGEILRRVIFFHNQKYKIPHFYTEFSPIPGHFVIFSNENALWDELIIKNYDKLSKQDINNSLNFINEFKSRKAIIKLNDAGKSLNFRKIVNYIFHDKNRLDVFTDYIRKIKKSILISRFYDEPNFNEKFAFFPLHYHIESRLTIRDPHCWRQEFIVEYVARSLPQGYKLYVKPHPEWPLAFPYEGLKLISEISNVKLINPSISSIDIIKKSDAVVVINSTAGFEALIYGKPVIVFGTEFYTDNDIVCKVNDLRKLPEILEYAIKKGIESKDLICFADAFLKANRKGDLNNLDRDNVKVVDGIFDYIESGELKNLIKLNPIIK
jgi:hypothetical protein